MKTITISMKTTKGRKVDQFTGGVITKRPFKYVNMTKIGTINHSENTICNLSSYQMTRILVGGKVHLSNCNYLKVG